MIRLPIIILIVAVLTKIASRFVNRSFDSQPQVRRVHLKVILTCGSKEDWHDTVIHLLQQASDPLCLEVRVLKECGSVKEVMSDEEVEASFKGVVRVVHVKRPPTECPLLRLRRSIQKCVNGDEDIVLSLHSNARLCLAWDSVIIRVMDETPSNSIITCPTASKKGTARFPTLRKKDASVFRGADRKIKRAAPLVESVCICYELCAFRPDSLSSITTWCSSVVDFTNHLHESGVTCFLPSIPLLDHDRNALLHVLSYDKGSPTTTFADCEAFGLTRGSSDSERISKFGSCKAAKLMIKFG